MKWAIQSDASSWPRSEQVARLCSLGVARRLDGGDDEDLFAFDISKNGTSQVQEVSVSLFLSRTGVGIIQHPR